MYYIYNVILYFKNILILSDLILCEVILIIIKLLIMNYIPMLMVVWFSVRTNAIKKILKTITENNIIRNLLQK